MLAIHDKRDHFSRRLRTCLKTTGMGLGLVRLLLDAGLTAEARTTLSSLQNAFQGVAEESDKPSQKHRKANRLNSVSRSFSFTALVAKFEPVQRADERRQGVGRAKTSPLVPSFSSSTG